MSSLRTVQPGEPTRIVVTLGRVHAQGSPLERARVREVVQEVLARAYRRADVIVVLDDETDEDRILLDDDIDSGPIDAEHIDSVSRLVAFVVSKHNASLEEQG